MKTNYLLIVLAFTGMFSCHSQDLKTGKKLQGKNKPEENVIVNKKYDENGNLIEFDSTYTSYYSNFEGDTLLTDSIFKEFNNYFNYHLSDMASNNFMLMDSTFMERFFHDDFFEQKFLLQDDQLLRMMKEMDSMKNEFFKMQLQSNEKLKL
jgi:hypothetical protein